MLLPISNIRVITISSIQAVGISRLNIICEWPKLNILPDLSSRGTTQCWRLTGGCTARYFSPQSRLEEVLTLLCDCRARTLPGWGRATAPSWRLEDPGGCFTTPGGGAGRQGGREAWREGGSYYWTGSAGGGGGQFWAVPACRRDLLQSSRKSKLFRYCLLVIIVIADIKQTNYKGSRIDFLRIFVWFPVDPRSSEHQLLHVNYRSLEEDDKQESESGGDGEDAEELLCEEHAAEPHGILSSAVDEIDDGPGNDFVVGGESSSVVCRHLCRR